MPQTNKEQPQAAWDSTDPEVGVETRGRKARCRAPGKPIIHRTRVLFPTPPGGNPLCRHRLESPQLDADAANEKNDISGNTRYSRENTKQSELKTCATTVELKQLESTRVIQDPCSDSDSDDSVDQIGPPSTMFDINNLSAAEVLEGPVLPNPGDFTSPDHKLSLFGLRTGLRTRFNEDGDFINYTDTEQKACQFAAAIINVLLTKKVDLKSSLQGFNLNAFFYTIAELLPQLGAFADAMDDASESKKLGTKMVWSLLMLIMEEAVTVEFGVAPLYGWSEAGIVALQKLDEFATNILVLLVYSPGDTVTEDALYSRYRNMKWLTEDLETLRRYRVLAQYFKGDLGERYFLEDTIREMESQLDRITAERN